MNKRTWMVFVQPLVSLARTHTSLVRLIICDDCFTHACCSNRWCHWRHRWNEGTVHALWFNKMPSCLARIYKSFFFFFFECLVFGIAMMGLLINNFEEKKCFMFSNKLIKKAENNWLSRNSYLNICYLLDNVGLKLYLFIYLWPRCLEKSTRPMLKSHEVCSQCKVHHVQTLREGRYSPLYGKV